MSERVVNRSAAGADVSREILNINLRALQIGAAVIFLLAGFAKLAGAGEVVAIFDAIEVGRWFRYATGVLETLGAIALLVPGYDGAGAVLLAGVMLGAILAHLFVIGGSPAVAIVLLAVTVIIAWGRRKQPARLVKG